MRKGRVLFVSVVGLSLGLVGCSGEPVQSVCNDAPKFEQAINSVDAENAQFKRELLEDVGEYAADAGNCSDYAGQGEKD